jgi:plasmid stability protein
MPLPDEVHRRVKAAAALRGQSVQAYVTEVLDEATADLEDAERKRRESGEWRRRAR